MNHLENIKNPSIFVQIGTNDGNDNFRNLVLKYKPKSVILVEPNYELISSIKYNYKSVEEFANVSIVNKCIYCKDNEEVSLFIPAKDGIYGNPGEQPERKLGNYTYNNKHFSLIPMNDWGLKKDMVEIKSKSISFKTLCEQHNILEIDYLQIDTEGYDSEIISSIDFNNINVKSLRYEKWPFDENCFSKYHNDNKHLYGLNGMKNVETILTKLNYKLFDINDEDGDDMIAVKY
jgi:FkbM family methyltransferase